MSGITGTIEITFVYLAGGFGALTALLLAVQFALFLAQKLTHELREIRRQWRNLRRGWRSR